MRDVRLWASYRSFATDSKTPQPCAWPASTPPSAGFEFGTHSIPPNCHQLYIAIVANAYAWLQGLQLSATGLHSVVIFVKYREVPTRTILPNFIGHYRDSVGDSVGFVFGRRRGQKRGKRKRMSFDSLANQDNSPGQPEYRFVHDRLPTPPFWRELQNFKFATHIAKIKVRAM